MEMKLRIAVSVLAILALIGCGQGWYWPSADRMVAKGDAARAAGDFKEARAYYTEALLMNDSLPYVLIFRGDMNKELGNSDEAIEDYTAALRLSQENAVNIQCAIGDLWFNKDDYDSAILAYSSAISCFDSQFDMMASPSFLSRARTSHDATGCTRLRCQAIFIRSCAGALSGRWQSFSSETVPFILEYLLLHPDHADAHFICSSNLRWSDVRAAWDHIDSAIRLNSIEPRYYSWRAEVFEEHQQKDLAARDYGIALRLLRDSSARLATAFIEEILHYHRLDQHESVAQLVRKNMNLYPHHDTTAIYTALLGYFSLRELNRPTEARRLLSRYLTRYDQDTWPTPLCRYLLGQGRSDTLLEQYPGRDPKTEAWTYLGLEALLEGDTPTARNYFEWVASNGNELYFEYAIASRKFYSLAEDSL